MRIAALTIALAIFSGCTSFGHHRIAPDRFNYNEAIAASANEQMLLNLVRLRYQDVPVFLVVGSVLTQYVYSGSAGINAAAGTAVGAAADSVGLSAGVIYIERPTITYNPLTGEDFSRQLLTPIPSDLIFSLIQSGWRADQLLSMSLQRINGVVNLPVDGPRDHYAPAERKKFERMLELTALLGRRGAIEMQGDISEDSNIRYLVFEDAQDADTRSLIDEYKELLQLDRGRSIYRVTEQLTRREADEVTIRVRSILTLMRFLATGVDVPAALRSHSWRPTKTASGGNAVAVDSPLKVYSSEDSPETAFVAVRYHDYWYYIKETDQESKQAFSLLTYLFQLQSPKAPIQGPVLTVPTG